MHLCNQAGQAIQLQGMSTHGLQWFADCYNTASLNALAGDWKADLLRISMYVQEGGYETNPSGFTSQVNNLVDQAEQSWQTIKNYAEQVIPVIRANDPDAVVIVGTRGWSSLGVSDGSSSAEITANPVRASNIMYAFHFYAASHKDNYRAELQRAAANLPLFVTEFGTVSATGGGAVDLASSTTWLNLLDQLKISYANWTFSDADESSAAFKPGTCGGPTYAGTGVLTESGAFIRNRIRG